ncbi:MAG: GDSL-type esterase/lipase family protein [Nitrospiria bacterium]
MDNNQKQKSRKQVRVLLFGYLFFLFIGCEDKTPTLSPLADGAVVLAFGDSLTFGTGAESGTRYPELLEGMIHRSVINSGIAGELTHGGLKRLPGLLEDLQPSLLILCHGGNDLLKKTGENQAADNIRSMIKLARNEGIGVVLIGVPRPDLSFSAPLFYKEIAEEFNIPYEEEVLANILSKRELKSDRVHPNGDGYRKLAEGIATLLKKARAI